jgi:hypothetical protein
MAAINWALITEAPVGRGHPTLPDVINRPLRAALTASGLDPDADFAGFATLPGLNGEATARAAGDTAAIATAAADATTKASNAQAAAIAAAAADATTKASNAQAAAIAAAAADAIAKSGNAQTAAQTFATNAVSTETTARVAGDAASVSSAATDATTKANNAQTAAQTFATSAVNTEATSRAAGDTAAIATAAADATTKANNAQTAAATDATTKANNAQTAAQTFATSAVAAEAATRTTNDATTLTSAQTYADAAVVPILKQWGKKTSTTTGLTYGYYGGASFNNVGVLANAADGTLALLASLTYYLERSILGVVSANTVSFTASLLPMAVIVTGVSTITSVLDQRNGMVGYYPPVSGETGVVDVRYPQANIMRHGAVPGGAVDATAAAQAAHDSLPATGGAITVPDGTFLFGVDGVYVNISKNNVSVLGSANAWIVSPNSIDAEVRTGSRYLNGFNITGTNWVVSVNMRGPLVIWTSQSAQDVGSIRNCKFLNMYNGAISINTPAFDVLDVDGVEFNTSRDLISDPGNYECITRTATAAQGAGNLIRVNRSTFRGVSGAIDAHNVRNLVIDGGTRFEGIDINGIKLATSDNSIAEQNLFIGKSVTFDGLPLNPASANRHLNLTPQLADRTATGTMNALWIQVFNNIHCSAKFKNFPNTTIKHLDGSFTNAVLNYDGARFDTCPIAIQDLQGTVTMRGAEFLNSNVVSTIAGAIRSLDITRCRFRDSVLNITKKSVAAGNLFQVVHNDIDYSLDNNAPIRFVNYGIDSGPTLLIDDNVINITGAGNTKVVDGGTGTRPLYGPNNQATAAAGAITFNGTLFPGALEPTTTAGATAPYLYRRHDGSVTIVNPNAAGVVQYLINDTSLPSAAIGTVFHAFRSHATNALQFTCVGGTINGFVTCQLGAQYDSVTFVKVAANQWAATSYRGSVTFF